LTQKTEIANLPLFAKSSSKPTTSCEALKSIEICEILDLESESDEFGSRQEILSEISDDEEPNIGHPELRKSAEESGVPRSVKKQELQLRLCLA
jgi:hypothetical protein